MKPYLLRLLSGSICFSLGVASCLVPVGRTVTSNTTRVSLETAAYEEGKSEAETDLSQGSLKFRIYGEPVEWDGPDLYAEHLMKDYGIEMVRVADCVVDDVLVERTRGYNEASLPIIESRFGQGILETVHQRAVAEWQNAIKEGSSFNRHHPHNVVRPERRERFS